MTTTALITKFTLLPEHLADAEDDTTIDGLLDAFTVAQDLGAIPDLSDGTSIGLYDVGEDMFVLSVRNATTGAQAATWSFNGPRTRLEDLDSEAARDELLDLVAQANRLLPAHRLLAGLLPAAEPDTAALCTRAAKARYAANLARDLLHLHDALLTAHLLLDAGVRGGLTITWELQYEQAPTGEFVARVSPGVHEAEGDEPISSDLETDLLEITRAADHGALLLLGDTDGDRAGTLDESTLRSQRDVLTARLADLALHG